MMYAGPVPLGGQKELKGHFSAIIIHKLLSIYARQFCQNLLSSGNGRDQTSKLEYQKYQLSPKKF